MNNEELKALAGDAKPNTLKEWLVEWKAWVIYRTATGREASITPRGRRELATLILLDGLLGPECEDKNCEDYDGEHPYHENVGVRMHEEGQRKLRADLQRANARIQELEQARNFDLKYQGTVTGRLSAAQPNLSNPPKPGPGRREQMTDNFGKMYFLNEAHELPPIKKSELRKQNKMKRDAKKAGKRWCKTCLQGPCGLWQHAVNGSDFCRKHK